MMECKINDRISYIPQVEKPLSADIVIVRGDARTFLFDVGNNDEAAQYCNALPGPKTVILSHFHIDHTAKLSGIAHEELYVGAAVLKKFPEAFPVASPVTIKDGVTVRILPVPSSHAKGSLLLEVDGELVFTGDATYAQWRGGEGIYNAQLLKEEIDVFQKLSAEKCFLSHDHGKIRAKESVLELLREIYGKRTKDCPYIYLDER